MPVLCSLSFPPAGEEEGEAVGFLSTSPIQSLELLVRELILWTIRLSFTTSRFCDAFGPEGFP